MKGIIILAHGSRQTATEQTLLQVVEMLRSKKPDHQIEYGFMEFSENTIEKGLDKLVQNGIKEIAAVPYFLFEGIHIREDIPEELEKYIAKHPEIKITLGQTLGADPRMADILADRVAEALK